MYFLIYRSEACNQTEESILKNILVHSREYNLRTGITGMLLFFDDKFMQLLEGDEHEVKLLFKKICTDSRNKQQVILKEGPINSRLFPGWSMSFRSLSKEELESEPAYKDVFTPGSAGSADLVSMFNLLRGKVRP